MPAWLIPAAISLGSAYLDSRKKKSQTQSSSYTPSPQEQAGWAQLWGAAGGAPIDPNAAQRTKMQAALRSGNPSVRLAAQTWLDRNPAPQGGMGGPPPLDPALTGAMESFGEYGNLGLGGARALGGNADAVRNMMNPYESEVMASLAPMYQKAREGAMSSIASRATQAGAFGGSRAAVSQGVALGELANQEAMTGANMRYQGFNDAMQRAGMLANLGMGANQARAGYGQYLSDRPFNMLRDAYSMVPRGGTQQSSQPVNRDPLQTGLGTFGMLWGMKGMPWSMGGGGAPAGNTYGWMS